VSLKLDPKQIVMDVRVDVRKGRRVGRGAQSGHSKIRGEGSPIDYLRPGDRIHVRLTAKAFSTWVIRQGLTFRERNNSGLPGL
jgi:hypothetical protein